MAVHYSGRFPNGEEFDSSYSRQRPFTFEIGVGRVIKCWDQAFLHLSKGVKAQINCPSDYAYGAGGAGRIIPPNSDLVFDVELVEINPTEEAAGSKAESNDENVSKSRPKRKSSWKDLPAIGDESTHICLTPLIAYASFIIFSLSCGYFLFAVFMPVAPMMRSKHVHTKVVAKKLNKKISEGKIA